MSETCKYAGSMVTSRERVPSGPTTRPPGAYVLLGLLLLLAVGALFGGGALVADPSGGLLELPVSLLDGSPFSNYLWPGIVLFLLFGVAPLLVVVGLWLRPARASGRLFGLDVPLVAAVFLGIALIVWIAVQMMILRFFLQPILLAQGVAIIVVALLPTVRRHYA